MSTEDTTKKKKKKTRKGNKPSTNDAVIKEKEKNEVKIKKTKQKKKDSDSEEEEGIECDCGCFVNSKDDIVENECCDSNSCKKCFKKYKTILTPIIKHMELEDEEEEKVEDSDKVCPECVSAEYFEIFIKNFKDLKINKLTANNKIVIPTIRYFNFIALAKSG